MKSIVGSVFCILIATIICSAQSVMYIPQVVDGLGGGTVWGTVIVITNPALLGTAAVASGTITFTQDNGTPWSLAFTDEQNQPVGSGGTIPFQIAAGETRYFLSAAFNSNGFNDPKLGKLQGGFATVKSNLAVAGGEVFLEFGVNGQIAEAGVPFSAAQMKQTLFVVKDNNDTAIAVANPGTVPADISFQLLNTNGTPTLPAVTQTLAANNHKAFFVGELFPNAPARFFGSMRVLSNVPLAMTELVFEPNGQFATLPVAPIQ